LSSDFVRLFGRIVRISSPWWNTQCSLHVQYFPTPLPLVCVVEHDKVGRKQDFAAASTSSPSRVKALIATIANFDVMFLHSLMPIHQRGGAGTSMGLEQDAHQPPAKAWEQAGLICRNAEAIVVTDTVTQAVSEDAWVVTTPSSG
jgi:hypothetical protein